MEEEQNLTPEEREDLHKALCRNDLRAAKLIKETELARAIEKHREAVQNFAREKDGINFWDQVIPLERIRTYEEKIKYLRETCRLFEEDINFREAKALKVPRSTPLALVDTEKAIEAIKAAAAEKMSDLPKPFIDAALTDPRIYLRPTDFSVFVRRNNPDLKSVKEAYEKSFKPLKVYRGICLPENSPALELLNSGILLSRTAAKEGLEASIKQEKEQNWYHGIAARLHHAGTSYEKSGFVLSVADYPEPQILAATSRLIPGKNKAYLISGQVAGFDLLNLSIADMYPSLKLFKHTPRISEGPEYEGCYFNTNAATERFVLHEIPIVTNKIITFDTPKQVYEFCEPFRQKMLKRIAEEKKNE